MTQRSCRLQLTARTVWDLSIQNVQVILHLHVRKFYCDQPGCPRRIFTERLPQVTSPHGRFTFGLCQFLGQLGREQGGASGAHSATLLCMQATARAILRFMHALPLPPITPPRVIGLDEWAWKRGQRYGAIVVDLERKKPIALLADRSQQTVAHWLKQPQPSRLWRGIGPRSLLPLSQRPFPEPDTWLIGGT